MACEDINPKARFDRMPIEQVLRIGRDFQNKDGFYRGAHYDTVKLLCDTIEHLRDDVNRNPRNCDRFNDYQSACVAWSKECDPKKNMLDGYDFAVWLFKTAKGGSGQ